jgi:undecaprenyl-diphosphatase
MALLCGVSRRMSEDFSFALALLITPAAIGRFAYRLLKTRDTWAWNELLDKLLPGLVGMVFSFLAGYVALWLLSAVLQHGRWWCFGVYCLVAALVLFTCAAYGL